MATIVLQVPDENLVSKVKQACKMLMGVASVKVQKSSPKVEDVANLNPLSHVLSAERPAAQHGEVVEGGGACESLHFELFPSFNKHRSNLIVKLCSDEQTLVFG